MPARLLPPATTRLPAQSLARKESNPGPLLFRSCTLGPAQRAPQSAHAQNSHGDYAAHTRRPQRGGDQLMEAQQRPEARHQFHVAPAHSAQQVENQEDRKTGRRPDSRIQQSAQSALSDLPAETGGQSRQAESNWRSAGARDHRSSPPVPPESRSTLERSPDPSKAAGMLRRLPCLTFRPPDWPEPAPALSCASNSDAPASCGARKPACSANSARSFPDGSRQLIGSIHSIGIRGIRVERRRRSIPASAPARTLLHHFRCLLLLDTHSAGVGAFH